MIYETSCNCDAKLKGKISYCDLCKFLEWKVKYIEGEMTRLPIEKYNLNVLFNSQRYVNEKPGLGFQPIRKTNNFKKNSFTSKQILLFLLYGERAYDQ